jgi:hypothetical protein
LFVNRTVPARFGAPYTTKLYGDNVVPGLYQLNIPARTGTNGFHDGYDVIRHLANVPFTQEHISVKLCRLFVHEDFAIGYDFTSPDLSEEGQLVKACMNAWENSTPQGQLRPVLEAIFSSALFRGHGGNAQKVKTPLEFTASAVRALRQSSDGSGMHGTWLASTDGYGITYSIGGGVARGLGASLLRMGDMSLFNREDPDGYPENGFGWISAGTLAERLRFVGSLLKASDENGIQAGKRDDNNLLTNNVTNPGGLLELRLPGIADRRDPGKVTDMFLGLIYPGEGRASLDAYRNLAVAYLNTADDGVTTSPFADLTPTSISNTAYDTRLRGMVALLLSLQRFHEQ